ncbi:MAG: hypothetical protein PHI40_03435 [Caldisericia bacterium]|nr:hypothetical protein [Caldisericia bacterium]
MILIVFGILQLVCVVTDLFFFPFLFHTSFFWIDLSIFACIGGLFIFDSTSLLISIPLLLIKLSYIPTPLLFVCILSYLAFIFLFFLLKNLLQINPSLLFVSELVFLFPFYLFFLSQFFDIAFFKTLGIQWLLFFTFLYPLLQLFRKSYESSISKHRVSP